MEHRGKAPVFKYEGLINFITRHSEESSAGVQRWAQSFMNKKLCPECLGTRLRKEAHFIRIGNKHIGDLVLPWSFLGWDLVKLNPNKGISTTKKKTWA
jgi:excinuclease ABC subunit A